MFSAKKALGLGLASATLFGASGCAGLETETLGGSVVSPKGECISGKTWLELAQQQEVYLGGDLKVDSANGVQDSLKLANTGKGVLDVVRSAGDEGTVSFPTSSAEVASNPSDSEEGGKSTEFSFNLNNGDESTSPLFKYSENSATFVIGGIANGSSIGLQITTTCAPPAAK